MAKENKEKPKTTPEKECEENASGAPKHNKKSENKGKKEKVRRRLSPDAPLHQVMPILLTALAALFGVCIYTQIEMGLLRSFVANVCFGMLGGGAYVIPIWFLIAALRWRDDARADVLLRSQVFGGVLIFLVSVLCYTFGIPANTSFSLKTFVDLGVERVGGGVVGGVFGYVFDKLVSKVGTVIIALALFFSFFLLAYGAVVKKRLMLFSARMSERAERMRERRQIEKEKRVAEEAEARNEKIRTESSFYDTLPAVVPTEGGAKEKTTSRVFSSETANKPVVRHLFDADADNTPIIPNGMRGSLSPSPSARAVASDGVPASSKNFYDAEAESPAPTPTPPKPEGFAFQEEPEIRIVSSRPIPANRSNPFGKTDAPTEREKQLPFMDDADDTPPEPTQTSSEVIASALPSTAEIPSDSAPSTEESSLVINKAHVVEHIGAETLASKEDIDKHAADTFFYSFPPLSLLHEDDEINKEDSDLEISAKADKLRETLHNFGVAADITCVSRGPRLTRYELVPKPGVRISKIENLVDEITMNLEAISVRIEAPIPGKAAIGVEVPNINTTTVRLRGLLDTDTFRDAPGKTTVCLGVDVVGKPVFADLDKMPHLLVAGATGMGKSVCINSLLISLLYKARPDEVKLILIDPKKVEFQSYANIPHLLVPVVTEPQKAAGALSWAVNEMERRYDLIETAAVRNIVAYNKTVDDHPGRVKMPQIVIVIDELHDLMLQARDAVEDSIARIAAKARAAGILLIIGTQRPSVNVITGVIKANIPSRIAFHVASQVDSRTILDAVGAEKLLNNGDMLFLSPGMKMMTPKRVQGAFLDDDEVNRVADYLRKNSSAVEYDESVMADMERESEKCNKDKKGADMGAVENGADMGEDELFYKAVEVALESGKISTSLLQRRLSLGFGKAARMIDRMCDLGIVSPPNGQKPRDVLITADEYRAMRLRNDE
ncbi:MAG: DNA translocase FtsK [Ruminococcaceae bacterium]|nr:DNA translocase FtsK [Oscillospiraceae bacterium]